LIKTSFISYPFELMEPLVPGDQITNELSGISLASPQEIALMKAYAIGRRAVFRDYIDMYVLLRDNHVSMSYINEKAPQKFILQNETNFSMRLFLQQLTYTADVESAEDKENAVKMLLAPGATLAEIEKHLSISAKDFMLSGLLPKSTKGVKLS
jgi:hypothetical protein